MLKNYLIIILTTTCFTLFSQKNRRFLHGTISDSFSILNNVHIVNLQSKKGTFSYNNGQFKILATINDTLKFSSVGYINKLVVITNKHFGIQKNYFTLKKQNIELDEVILKKHNLTGTLSTDVGKIPKDIAANKSKNAIDFSAIDFSKKVTTKIDEIDRAKPTNARYLTDPTAKFAGIGGSYTNKLDAYAAKKRKIRKMISFKENFPKLLLADFGTTFFFTDLKIPKENYYHFLDYCSTYNIEELYKTKKILELIKILKQQSALYLKEVKQTY